MPRLTSNEWKGFLAGYVLAIASTVLRLGHRLHRRQLWWDDLWAFIALFFAVFNVVVYLLLNIPDDGPTRYNEDVSSFFLWSSFQFQPIIIWASRVSIQVTVIRFLSDGRNRIISKCAVVVLLLMWVASAITKVFYCGTPVPKLPFCEYKKMPSVVALVFDVLSTVWLIGWPIYILFQMKLARPGRNLIIACFSSGGLVGAMAIFHAVNLLTGAFATLNISGHVEIMVALVSCNVLVLVTYIYRVFRGPLDDSDEESSDESEISRSKREAATSRPLQTQVTGLALSEATRPTTDKDSSVGPLTTVYSSSENYSSHGGTSSFPSQAGSAVTNPTTPLGSLSSKA